VHLRLASLLSAVVVGLLPASVAPGTAVAAVPVVDHVVLVSVDGLNPDAIRQLGRTGAPTFYRLMTQGASTMNARTVYDATQTLPNHTSMVTGRPVTAAGGHRVTFNEDNGSTVHVRAGTYVASTFDVVHDSGGRTALYAGKEKFDFLDRSWNATNGAVDRTGVNNGRDKIDVYRRAAPGVLTDALIAALRSAPPDFAMLHLRGPDSVGHAQGYMSQAYVNEVAATDRLIGRLLNAVAGSPSLASSTTVVVTSDHGGLGFSHADPTRAVNYTIPFFVWGRGVPAGADLYARNPDRANPGTSRPTYAAAVQPIRNAEAGNLVTELLGLRAIPGSRINAAQTLDVA
jgi:predicted AlkP superfamily pyrophosphatase or phosphodiesterase